LKFGVVCGVDLKEQKTLWKWIVLSVSVTASKTIPWKKVFVFAASQKGK